MMLPLSHLAWPFFSEAHRQFGAALADWANREISQYVDHANVDRSCRSLVLALGEAGWLKAVVPAKYGGLSESGVERIFRAVPASKIYEGTNDIQRLVISRALVAEAEKNKRN